MNRLLSTSFSIARRAPRAWTAVQPAASLNRIGSLGLLARPSWMRSFSSEETVNFSFKLRDGSVKSVKAKVGETLLDVSQNHNIDEVEGACEGACACSTCHMIFSEETYDKLPKPSEDELDMLDLALHLTDTSRLGCQVEVSTVLAGTTIQLPEETADMQ